MGQVISVHLQGPICKLRDCFIEEYSAERRKDRPYAPHYRGVWSNWVTKFDNEVKEVKDFRDNLKLHQSNMSISDSNSKQSIPQEQEDLCEIQEQEDLYEVPEQDGLFEVQDHNDNYTKPVAKSMMEFDTAKLTPITLTPDPDYEFKVSENAGCKAGTNSIEQIVSAPNAKSRSKESKRGKATNITTILLAQFQTTGANNESSVKIEYQFSRQDAKDYFKSSCSIKDLLVKMGKTVVENESGSDETAEMNLFFQNLQFLINTCYGEVEWNGATILCKDDPKDRIKLVEYEMEPTKLYISVAGLDKDMVKMNRTPDLLEISGCDETGPKWFRMKGPAISVISFGRAYDNKLCVNFPGLEP